MNRAGSSHPKIINSQTIVLTQNSIKNTLCLTINLKKYTGNMSSQSSKSEHHVQQYFERSIQHFLIILQRMSFSPYDQPHHLGWKKIEHIQIHQLFQLIEASNTCAFHYEKDHYNGPLSCA